MKFTTEQAEEIVKRELRALHKHYTAPNSTISGMEMMGKLSHLKYWKEQAIGGAEVSEFTDYSDLNKKAEAELKQKEATDAN